MTSENEGKLLELVRRDAVVRGFYMFHARGDMALDDALVNMIVKLVDDNRALFEVAVDLQSKSTRPAFLDMKHD